MDILLRKNKNAKVIVGPSRSMSKSKKNTIDPEKIIENYGATQQDYLFYQIVLPRRYSVVRWYNSSYKFIQKLWLLNQKIVQEISKNHLKDSSINLSKYTNRYIKKMTDNLSCFSYNVLIANLHEMYSPFL